MFCPNCQHAHDEATCPACGAMGVATQATPLETNPPPGIPMSAPQYAEGTFPTQTPAIPPTYAPPPQYASAPYPTAQEPISQYQTTQEQVPQYPPYQPASQPPYPTPAHPPMAQPPAQYQAPVPQVQYPAFRHASPEQGTPYVPTNPYPPPPAEMPQWAEPTAYDVQQSSQYYPQGAPQGNPYEAYPTQPNPYDPYGQVGAQDYMPNSAMVTKAPGGLLYLILSIIMTFCWCPPAGIVAWVFTSKFKESWYSSDMLGFEDNKRKAKVSLIVGGVVAVIVCIGVLVLSFSAVGMAFSMLDDFSDAIPIPSVAVPGFESSVTEDSVESGKILGSGIYGVRDSDPLLETLGSSPLPLTAVSVTDNIAIVTGVNLTGKTIRGVGVFVCPLYEDEYRITSPENDSGIFFVSVILDQPCAPGDTWALSDKIHLPATTLSLPTIAFANHYNIDGKADIVSLAATDSWHSYVRENYPSLAYSDIEPDPAAPVGEVQMAPEIQEPATQLTESYSKYPEGYAQEQKLATRSIAMAPLSDIYDIGNLQGLEGSEIPSQFDIYNEYLANMSELNLPLVLVSEFRHSLAGEPPFAISLETSGADIADITVLYLFTNAEQDYIPVTPSEYPQWGVTSHAWVVEESDLLGIDLREYKVAHIPLVPTSEDVHITTTVLQYTLADGTVVKHPSLQYIPARALLKTNMFH